MLAALIGEFNVASTLIEQISFAWSCLKHCTCVTLLDSYNNPEHSYYLPLKDE